MITFNSGLMPNTHFFGRFASDPHWAHFERVSPEYVLYIIIAGEMFIRLDDQEYHLLPNDVLTILPGQHQIGYRPAYCDYYFLHFDHPSLQPFPLDGEQMRDLAEQMSRRWLSTKNATPFLPGDTPAYLPVYFTVGQDVLNKMGDYYTESTNLLSHKYPYYKMVLSSLTNLVLLTLARAFVDEMGQRGTTKKRKSIVQIHRIIAHIHLNYREHITREDIEQLTNLNYDYINREFKKNTQTTIIGYLTEVRIQKAKDLVISSNLDFGRIGELVGFENPYYFSKIFKKSCGITLSQYVKNHYSASLVKTKNAGI